MILEACVETLGQAISAERQGADQLELCDRLDLGGVSPNFELVQSVLSQVNIPVKLMLRPRGGDFTYSSHEMHQMQNEIIRSAELRIAGFVFGALDHLNEINIEQTNLICHWAQGRSVTFHKAIDLCPDIFRATSILNATPVKYILSSGGKETAMRGAKTLYDMQKNSTIQIIGAGKITDINLTEIAKASGLNYFHGRKIVGSLIG